jgi:hypothetical protein
MPPKKVIKEKVVKEKKVKGRKGKGGGLHIKSNYQKVIVNNRITTRKETTPSQHYPQQLHTTTYLPYRIGEPTPPKKDDEIPTGIPIADVVSIDGSSGIPTATPVEPSHTGSSYKGVPTIVIANKKEDAVSTPIKQVFEGTYSMRKPEAPVITKGDFYTPTIVRKNIEETKVESPIYRLTTPPITNKKKAVSRINEKKETNEPKKRGRPPKQTTNPEALEAQRERANMYKASKHNILRLKSKLFNIIKEK